MISLTANGVLRLLRELRTLYAGFSWESELWPRVGPRRSPYRALVLFGLSARTRDALLVEMCREFFSRFPAVSDLSQYVATGCALDLRLLRPGQRPFVESMAQVLGSGVPRHRDGLLTINGVGDKIAECVLAYGWGEDALPVDANCVRVLQRVAGGGRRQARGLDPGPLRETLKSVYLRNESQFADLSISMVDIHEILRLHGQVCCTRLPACAACPVTGCQSRRQPHEEGKTVRVSPAYWDDWRELINEPGGGESSI